MTSYLINDRRRAIILLVQLNWMYLHFDKIGHFDRPIYSWQGLTLKFRVWAARKINSSKRIFSFIDIIYTNTNLFVLYIFAVSNYMYQITDIISRDTIFFFLLYSYCIYMVFVTLALALVISKSNQSLNFNSIAPQSRVKWGHPRPGILWVFYWVIWGPSMGWQVLFYVLSNCLFLNEGRISSWSTC